MARRPLFVVSDNQLPERLDIEFVWHPGLSLIQKQKCINSLHTAALKHLGQTVSPILEISSKSPLELGIQTSAFNLRVELNNGSFTSVESIFQSSKVFKNGGPFKDLLSKPARDAKRDPRLRDSGSLLRFQCHGRDWPLDPPSLFYDWVYINALHRNKTLSTQILEYQSFSDIEFNPKRQVNCQGYSAALYASLVNQNLIDIALKSEQSYSSLIKSKRTTI
jgi:hypothetical protein